MSTGLNCLIIEVVRDAAGQPVVPPEWYLILEKETAPKAAWDWREYANAYGPFTGQDATLVYLGDNFANPGGFTVTTGIELQDDQVLRGLVDRATEPVTPNRWQRW